jgi:hypothetical protein
VVVDSLQIQFVDGGDEGCKNQLIRSHFSPPAKFVAVRAKPFQGQKKDRAGTLQATEIALYPGVDAERALVLTSEYLLDLFRLVSDRPRVYDWHVQGSGRIKDLDEAVWRESQDLAQGKFWAPGLKAGQDPAQVRKKEAGQAAWGETILQGGEGDETVGVRVSMLPAQDTALFRLSLPGTDPAHAVTLLARRQCPETVFTALHEPIQGGGANHKVIRFERLAESNQGLAVLVRGKEGSEIDDRVLVQYGESQAGPITLAGQGETFTFRDFAYVRVGPGLVKASGFPKAFTLKVGGPAKLELNGKEEAAECKEGLMTWKEGP